MNAPRPDIRAESRAVPRLVARGLTRVLAGREVVSELSLTVRAGQVTCLLGPSGCGKSTTLRMLAGVDVQDRGEIALDGEVVAGPGAFVPPENRGVGLMFQDFALFPHLSVARNVAFGLRGPRAGRRARAMDLLERVELARFADAYPHELSGGEQQRVALMRALAPRPRVMLMDEPFSGLDNRLRDGIRDETLDLLKDEGTAVVLVTHEPEEAMRMADEIVLMRDGRVVQTGAPYNLYHAPADAAAAAFFSDVNVIRGRSNGALTETAFGAFLTPGHAAGSEVEIVFRPQHVAIDFDRGGRGPNPTPAQGTPVAGHRPARAVHGLREPGGVRDGGRRGPPARRGAGGVPAATGHGPVAVGAPRPLLRLRRRGAPRRGLGRPRALEQEEPLGLRSGSLPPGRIGEERSDQEADEDQVQREHEDRPAPEPVRGIVERAEQQGPEPTEAGAFVHLLGHDLDLGVARPSCLHDRVRVHRYPPLQ